LIFVYSQVVGNSAKEKELKGFDPYDILEVPKDINVTSDQELIKKQFKFYSSFSVLLTV